MPEIYDLTLISAPPFQYQHILSSDALHFVAKLEQRFGNRRLELLDLRKRRQQDLDAGKLPSFLPETEEIRRGSWKIAPIPRDLIDRRVEITGPVERKMVINALNSGAKVFMADFEDSHSPTWLGTLQGQVNLYDAARHTIALVTPAKTYTLNSQIATLVVRPRGWHLEEKHVLFGGRSISASLFDFGLYFFHNAKELLKHDTGPYFYLPKLESHLEAKLWNEVFIASQEILGIPIGTIKATVLIETILAAFEMDEILYELREHSAGLNCGRWDYIFSFIKKFHKDPKCVMPDRQSITMSCHFLKSYSELVIRTCHRRGAHAMGGMAAQIPIKNNPDLNQAAVEKVFNDKLREVKAGHDGTWVAHPALVEVAMGVFNSHMKGPNQLLLSREDVHVTASDLLTFPKGKITRGGVKNNVSVGLQYIESWLRGNGCVPLFNLMEDAATAEISRAQLWQWVHHGSSTDDGIPVTAEYFRKVLKTEVDSQRNHLKSAYPSTQFELAASILEQLVTSATFPEFLTTVCYDFVCDSTVNRRKL